MSLPNSSFAVHRVNQTTFLIVEQDAYKEHPHIYAKVHPEAPIIVLSDTGCDAPAKQVHGRSYVHLRHFLEQYPLADNDAQPINPGGKRSYVVLLSHCHYDHIGGIDQFNGGEHHIVASAAGRDFIESNLPAHSLCKHVGIKTPGLQVTHWAQSNERLTWPLATSMPGDDISVDKLEPKDLGIIILQTPGHTPDALAWYDETEDTIYVGDSFYMMGKDFMPIIFPPQGDLVEWMWSLSRVAFYIYRKYDPRMLRDEDHDDWADAFTIKLCAAHSTYNVEALQNTHRAVMFLADVCDGNRKVVLSERRFDEVFDYYISDFEGVSVHEAYSLLIPRRLVDDARHWFGGHARNIVLASLPEVR